MDQIARPKTPEERAEYKDLKQKDARQTFLTRLAEVGQKYVEKHDPYCTKCAIAEFDLELMKKKTEISMRTGADADEFSPTLIEFAKEHPLEKYGDLSSFKLVGERQRTEKRLVGANTWIDMVIIEKDYACKAFGHRCCISCSKEEYESTHKK